MESGIVVSVSPKGIVVEDDFGGSIHVPTFYVVGEPRIGATCTLVARASENYGSFRAFVQANQ